VSSFARYQALAELCTGKAHHEVGAQVSAHIDRLYSPQADRLNALYEQRYARFQKIRKCPAREFSAAQEHYETRSAELNALEPMSGLKNRPSVSAPAPAPTRRERAGSSTVEGQTSRPISGRASTPAAGRDPAMSAEELYKQGIANFLSPRRAVELFTEAIAVNSNAVKGYRARAWAHLADRNPIAALADFDRVLAIDSNDSEAYRGRGWARFELGRYQLARADFSESIARARNQAEGYAGRGLASFFLGELALARSDFRATMRYQPGFNDAEIYSRAGDLLAMPATAGREPESYDPRVRQAQRRDPRFGADVSTRLDDWARYRKAEARVRQALNANSNNADAWLALAVASYRQVDDDPGLGVSGTVRREARAAFNSAVSADPNSTEIRLARAMFRATPGVGNDPEAAIADLDAAIRLNPNDGEAYVRRALVRAVSNEPVQLAQAIEDCETAGRIRPGDGALPELCQMLRGRHAQAQLAEQRRAAYEEKYAEFETEAWLVIGAMLTAVFTANYQEDQVCFDEEGIARMEVAARADGRCYR
jgi:tetratricopeptide (TPR) repeat protein